MMAYLNDYVVSVIVDGKPIRELAENDTRTCRIPFGSEYSLRLKNKTYKRAMVQVSIDGTDVVMNSRLILQAGATMDLERFVESNIQGRKFRFVTVGDPCVQDPTSSSNGLITITFWPETDYVFSTIFGGGQQYSNTASQHLNGTTITTGSVNSSMNCTLNAELCRGLSIGSPDKGATVEGSISNQQFSLGSWFPTSSPTTISLWLKGPSQSRPAETGIVIAMGGPKPEVRINGVPVHVDSVSFVKGIAEIKCVGFEIKSDTYKLV